MEGRSTTRARWDVQSCCGRRVRERHVDALGHTATRSAAMVALLIAGLGNLPYPLTRHSVGHLIIDSLALRLGIPLVRDRRGFVGHGTASLGRTPTALTLFKSKFPMNISGPSIAAVYRKSMASPKPLIVVADSLLHRIETLSVKMGGSANGHNGVKSVVTALGGESDFYRFRIGIGRNETEAATYVMHKLSSHECQFWANDGLGLVLSELEIVVSKNSS